MTASAAFILVLVGLLSIYCEFVWPGRVLPGLAGSIFVVSGCYALTHFAPSSAGLTLVGVAAALFTLEACWRINFWSGLLATAALSVGSSILVTGRDHIPWELAIPASVVFGGITVLLCYGAKRARCNKWSDIVDAQQLSDLSRAR